MAKKKRKKHQKLPNGYGSIKYLGDGRRNPYAVHPPTKEFNIDGIPQTPKALCYVDDWYKAFTVLTWYKNNEYYPGREAELSSDQKELEKQVSEILSQYTQKVIDNCELKHASLELIQTLFRQMYQYAEANNLCDKNYAQFVRIDQEDDDEHGVPFTDSELKILWDNKENETVEMILIMCYSGFRIAAYESMKVDLNKKAFYGGVKTKYSKKRTVPIHSGIYDLVKRRLSRDGALLTESSNAFRNSMYEALNALGIEKHTPHDCRHTFSKLCEDSNVAENDRKRMLGHSFGNDITNKVYGHRSLEDLREEIEKIKICY